MEEYKQTAEAVYIQMCTVVGWLGWIAALSQNFDIFSRDSDLTTSVVRPSVS